MEYSFKIHLVCALVSYVFMSGYDLRETQLKNLKSEAKAYYSKNGLAAFARGVIIFLVLGPLSIPAAIIFRLTR